MKDRVSKLIDRDEASQLIDLKQGRLEVMLAELKEDSTNAEQARRRLEEKIDRLLTKDR